MGTNAGGVLIGRQVPRQMPRQRRRVLSAEWGVRLLAFHSSVDVARGAGLPPGAPVATAYIPIAKFADVLRDEFKIHATRRDLIKVAKRFVEYHCRVPHRL